jgi:DNA-binding Lrp family transcriptional regulator
VQEVHIITGDWDFLIKVKEKDVNAVGRFVVDKLRTVPGISKTLTIMVFDPVEAWTSLKAQPLITVKPLLLDWSWVTP